MAFPMNLRHLARHVGRHLSRSGLLGLAPLCAWSAGGLPPGATEFAMPSGEKAVLLASRQAPTQPDLREVSVLRVLPAPRTVYGVAGTQSLQMVYRMNCVSREWSITEVVLYPDRAMANAPLQRFDLSTQKVAYPPLDSDPLASRVFALACSPTALASSPAAPAGTPPQAPDAASPPASTAASPAPGPGTGDPATLPAGPQAGPLTGQPVSSEPLADDVAQPGGGRPGPGTASGSSGLLAGNDPGRGADDVPMSEGRPFEDVRWTLGTLSTLARHAYTDPHNHAARVQAMPVLDRLLEQHMAARSAAAATPAAPPEQARLLPRLILQAAIAKGEESLREYEEDAREKTAFLQAAGLVEDIPPAVEARLRQARNSPFLAGLRIEFYRQRDSGDHAIVFRGSAQGADWLSNAWLGVDLAQEEAPYYREAREIVGEFLKARPQARVVVVGHSLGGGLAQYTGNHYGLRVVAFNSSPLPPRYIGGVTDRQKARTRVYTAVYRDPMAGRVTSDFLSIGITREVQSGVLAGRVARATQHLVRPTCTLARPEPFYSPEEQRKFAEAAGETISSPAILSRLGFINGALKLPHSVSASLLVDDPMWADAASRHGLGVKLMGKAMINAGSNKTYGVQSGLLSAGQIGKQLLDRRLGSLGWNLAGKAGLMGLRSALIYLQLDHAMPRYARGLQQISAQDSFNQLNASADPAIKAKCDSLAQLF